MTSNVYSRTVIARKSIARVEATCGDDSANRDTNACKREVILCLAQFICAVHFDLRRMEINDTDD